MLAVHFIDIPMVGQAIKDNFDHLGFRTGQHRHTIRRDVDMGIVDCEHTHYLSLKIFRLFGFSQNTRLIIEATAQRNKPETPKITASSFSAPTGFDRRIRTLEEITERRFSTLFCYRCIELPRTGTVAEGVHNGVDALKLWMTLF